MPYKILTGTDKVLGTSVNEVGVCGDINSPTVDVIIPSTVTHGGVTYTVSRIYTMGNSKFKSLTFPPTIHTLESMQDITIDELHIPSTITKIEFQGLYHSHIKEVWLPSTGLKEIGGGYSLWSYDMKRIHGLAQSQIEYIGYNCILDWYYNPTTDYLNDLAVLPSTIREIGSTAFTAYHDGLPLDKVTIPASMEKLGDQVYNIAHDVYIKGDNPFTLGTTPFGTQTTLKVHVPADRTFVFRPAAAWTDYADKLVEDVEIGSTGYTTYYLEN